MHPRRGSLRRATAPTLTALLLCATVLVGGAAAQAAPFISVSHRWDSVFAGGFGAGATLDGRIYEAPGGPQVGAFSIGADGQGSGGADIAFDIVPGMVVTVGDGSIVKELEVADLFIDLVNPQTGTITGAVTAPNGTIVHVNDGQAGGDVAASTSGGTWSASFGDIGWDTRGNAWLADGDGDITEVDKETPRIQVFPKFESVGVEGFTGGISVDIEIRDGVDLVFDTTHALSPYGEGDTGHLGDFVDVRPGLDVSVTDGAITKQHRVGAVSIDRIDLALDRITGIAEAGVVVGIQIFETETPIVPVQAGPDGSWVADLAGIHDLDTTTTMAASTADAEADRTLDQRGPPQFFAGVERFDFLAHICGGPVTPGVLVTFDVFDAPPPDGRLRATTTTPADENGFMCADIENFTVAPGMFVRVGDGTYTKEFRMTALMVEGIDPANDLAFGTAEPGATIHVDVANSGAGSVQVVAAPTTGEWTADIGAVGGDVTDDSSVIAHIIDSDGDGTTFERFAPHLRVEVPTSLTASQFRAGAPVTFSIYDAPGGSLVVDPPSVVTADEWGEARYSGVQLEPGMEIVVTDGLVTHSVVVPDATIESFDVIADTAQGSAAPGEVFAFASHCGLTEAEVHADDVTGAWSIAYWGDLVSSASVCLGTNSADVTITRRTPIVSADPRQDLVLAEGFAFGVPVTVEVFEPESGQPAFSTTVTPQDSSVSDSNDVPGQVRITPDAHGVDIRPGVVVRGTQGATVKETTVEAFTVDRADPIADIVTGAAPVDAAGRKVTVSLDLQFVDKPVTSTGQWQVVPPPDYFGATSQVVASITDEQGDRTLIARGAAEEVRAVVPAGGTLTTDTEADGATTGDPIENSVTTPVGGEISITEEEKPWGAPASFYFLGQRTTIAAPSATPAQPLEIALLIDVSRVPPRHDAASIAIYRNDSYVPPCAGAPSDANPDPCVSRREDLSDGDVRIMIRTSQASLWTQAVSSDARPPALDQPSFSTNPKAVSQTTVLSASATDGLSGLGGGEFFIGSDPGVGSATPMMLGDTSLFASIGTDLAPGTYEVGVRAHDRAGNWSEVRTATLTVQTKGTGGGGPPSTGSDPNPTPDPSSSPGATASAAPDGTPAPSPTPVAPPGPVPTSSPSSPPGTTEPPEDEPPRVDPRCDDPGVVCGSNGDDLLTGTSGPDLIIGGEGNDTIVGFDGDDVCVGGGGDDTIECGGGDDVIKGGGGADRLRSTRGSDLIYGGAGRDAITGGAGPDRLFGGGGGDVIHGDSGDDLVAGGSGWDRMVGGAGNDVFRARDGERDRISGGRGRDRARQDRGDRVAL